MSKEMLFLCDVYNLVSKEQTTNVQVRFFMVLILDRLTGKIKDTG